MSSGQSPEQSSDGPSTGDPPTLADLRTLLENHRCAIVVIIIIFSVPRSIEGHVIVLPAIIANINDIETVSRAGLSPEEREEFDQEAATVVAAWRLTYDMLHDEVMEFQQGSQD